MRGDNKIIINQATMREALQGYFNKIYEPSYVPIVENVETKNDSYNGDTYEITVKESEKK